MQFRTTFLAAIAACCASAALAKVAPPPLPPGASQVRPQAGLNEDERQRFIRAHHHKGHHKKDFTADDSLPQNDRQPAKPPAAGPKK